VSILVKLFFNHATPIKTILAKDPLTTKHIFNRLEASIIEILRFIKYHDKNNDQHGKFCDEHSLHQMAAQDWFSLLVIGFVQRKQGIAMNDLENDLKTN